MGSTPGFILERLIPGPHLQWFGWLLIKERREWVKNGTIQNSPIHNCPQGRLCKERWHQRLFLSIDVFSGRVGVPHWYTNYAYCIFIILCTRKTAHQSHDFMVVTELLKKWNPFIQKCEPSDIHILGQLQSRWYMDMAKIKTMHVFRLGNTGKSCFTRPFWKTWALGSDSEQCFQTLDWKYVGWLRACGKTFQISARRF